MGFYITIEWLTMESKKTCMHVNIAEKKRDKIYLLGIVCVCICECESIQIFRGKDIHRLGKNPVLVLLFQHAKNKIEKGERNKECPVLINA